MNFQHFPPSGRFSKPRHWSASRDLLDNPGYLTTKYKSVHKQYQKHTLGRNSFITV